MSKLGHTSRSRARPLIEAGQVAVNNQIIRNPEHRIDIERDRVSVRGHALALESSVYIMLHKPAGVVTTRSDERGRRTVYDLLEKAALPHISAVGRLDLDSEGLLLFTNDTRWAHYITAPESHVDKIYHVRVDRRLAPDHLRQLCAGVHDRGELLRAKAAAEIDRAQDEFWLELVLDEGKNRQIRRMLATSGVRVLRLKRVAVGALTLGTLRPGEFRHLTASEIKAFRR